MPRRSEGVNLDGAPKDGPDYDDFERGALIGSGGNADVYRSTLMLDDTPRPVAMKEPRIQGTVLAESTEMFAAEARTWSRLDNHANIVTVVAYGSSPIPWIALEYMDQGDLSTVSSELSLQDKLRIAIQITDAVWHAHQRGVAHLDLKPQNILLEAGDGDSNLMAKVADWGLSRMLLENSASVEGLSPQYSAPEQFDAEKYGSPDNQTDIFQLGVILYELFAGQHPFGNSATEAMHGILNEATVPLGIHDPDLPVEVEDAVGPALAKSKVDRYEAVVYLRDALESIRSSAE
jgi:serine/threonine protein kinase